jgi:hypothetical protein
MCGSSVGDMNKELLLLQNVGPPVSDPAIMETLAREKICTTPPCQRLQAIARSAPPLPPGPNRPVRAT